MKKPLYSAKPGNYEVFTGKRNKTMQNLDRYNSIEDSEKRRSEIKKELFVKETMKTCLPEIRGQVRLGRLSQRLKKDPKNSFYFKKSK